MRPPVQRGTAAIFWHLLVLVTSKGSKRMDVDDRGTASPVFREDGANANERGYGSPCTADDDCFVSRGLVCYNTRCNCSRLNPLRAQDSSGTLTCLRARPPLLRALVAVVPTAFLLFVILLLGGTYAYQRLLRWSESGRHQQGDGGNDTALEQHQVSPRFIRGDTPQKSNAIKLEDTNVSAIYNRFVLSVKETRPQGLPSGPSKPLPGFLQTPLSVREQPRGAAFSPGHFRDVTLTSSDEGLTEMKVRTEHSETTKPTNSRNDERLKASLAWRLLSPTFLSSMTSSDDVVAKVERKTKMSSFAKEVINAEEGLECERRVSENIPCKPVSSEGSAAVRTEVASPKTFLCEGDPEEGSGLTRASELHVGPEEDTTRYAAAYQQPQQQPLNPMERNRCSADTRRFCFQQQFPSTQHTSTFKRHPSLLLQQNNILGIGSPFLDTDDGLLESESTRLSFLSSASSNEILPRPDIQSTPFRARLWGQHNPASEPGFGSDDRSTIPARQKARSSRLAVLEEETGLACVPSVDNDKTRHNGRHLETTQEEMNTCIKFTDTLCEMRLDYSNGRQDIRDSVHQDVHKLSKILLSSTSSNVHDEEEGDVPNSNLYPRKESVQACPLWKTRDTVGYDNFMAFVPDSTRRVKIKETLQYYSKHVGSQGSRSSESVQDVVMEASFGRRGRTSSKQPQVAGNPHVPINLDSRGPQRASKQSNVPVIDADTPKLASTSASCFSQEICVDSVKRQTSFLHKVNAQAPHTDIPALVKTRSRPRFASQHTSVPTVNEDAPKRVASRSLATGSEKQVYASLADQNDPHSAGPRGPNTPTLYPNVLTGDTDPQQLNDSVRHQRSSLMQARAPVVSGTTDKLSQKMRGRGLRHDDFPTMGVPLQTFRRMSSGRQRRARKQGAVPPSDVAAPVSGASRIPKPGSRKKSSKLPSHESRDAKNVSSSSGGCEITEALTRMRVAIMGNEHYRRERSRLQKQTVMGGASGNRPSIPVGVALDETQYILQYDVNLQRPHRWSTESCTVRETACKMSSKLGTDVQHSPRPGTLHPDVYISTNATGMYNVSPCFIDSLMAKDLVRVKNEEVTPLPLKDIIKIRYPQLVPMCARKRKTARRNLLLSTVDEASSSNSNPVDGDSVTVPGSGDRRLLLEPRAKEKGEKPRPKPRVITPQAHPSRRKSIEPPLADGAGMEETEGSAPVPLRRNIVFKRMTQDNLDIIAGNVHEVQHSVPLLREPLANVGDTLNLKGVRDKGGAQRHLNVGDSVDDRTPRLQPSPSGFINRPRPDPENPVSSDTTETAMMWSAVDTCCFQVEHSECQREFESYESPRLLYGASGSRPNSATHSRAWQRRCPTRYWSDPQRLPRSAFVATKRNSEPLRSQLPIIAETTNETPASRSEPSAYEASSAFDLSSDPEKGGPSSQTCPSRYANAWAGDRSFGTPAYRDDVEATSKHQQEQERYPAKPSAVPVQLAGMEAWSSSRTSHQGSIKVFSSAIRGRLSKQSFHRKHYSKELGTPKGSPYTEKGRFEEPRLSSRRFVKKATAKKIASRVRALRKLVEASHCARHVARDSSFILSKSTVMRAKVKQWNCKTSTAGSHGPGHVTITPISTPSLSLVQHRVRASQEFFQHDPVGHGTHSNNVIATTTRIISYLGSTAATCGSSLTPVEEDKCRTSTDEMRDPRILHRDTTSSSLESFNRFSHTQKRNLTAEEELMTQNGAEAGLQRQLQPMSRSKPVVASSLPQEVNIPCREHPGSSTSFSVLNTSDADTLYAVTSMEDGRKSYRSCHVTPSPTSNHASQTVPRHIVSSESEWYSCSDSDHQT